MNEDDIKALASDHDGLANYEYLANNIGRCDEDIPAIIDNMQRVDLTGQYMASAARFLHAIDAEHYADAVHRLVALTIDRDRERRYLGDLLTCIYGEDYADRAQQLIATDNNFRRIYKRLFPESPM